MSGLSPIVHVVWRRRCTRRPKPSVSARIAQWSIDRDLGGGEFDRPAIVLGLDQQLGFVQVTQGQPLLLPTRKVLGNRNPSTLACTASNTEILIERGGAFDRRLVLPRLLPDVVRLTVNLENPDRLAGSTVRRQPG